MRCKNHLIAVLFTLVLIPTSQAADSDKEKDTGLLESSAFSDTKSGITAQLPKGWVPKKGIQSTGYEAPEKDRADGGSLAPNVVFTKTKEPNVKATDLAKVIEQKRKQYPQTFPGYKETESQSIDVNGKPGHIIGYTFVVQNVLTVQQKQVWVVTDGEVYLVTCTSLKATYEKNEKTFDAVIKTVVIP